MKSRLFALAFAALASLSLNAAATEFAAPTTDAVVKKIDVPGKRLTLTHGPIENLGMPGMTMSFSVADPALLKDVKLGEALRVRIENLAGDYTVVRIARPPQSK